MAYRGSTEIASALLLYITENFNPLTPREERKLVVSHLDWESEEEHQHREKYIQKIYLVLDESARDLQLQAVKYAFFEVFDSKGIGGDCGGDHDGA
nr:unnamed protein product [Callosobruchus chinensis]